MAEQPNAESAGSRSVMYCLVVAVCLMLYPLSVGPAAKLFANKTYGGGVLKVYKPLFFLADHFRPARWFIAWYVFELWNVDEISG